MARSMLSCLLERLRHRRGRETSFENVLKGVVLGDLLGRRRWCCSCFCLRDGFDNGNGLRLLLCSRRWAFRPVRKVVFVNDAACQVAFEECANLVGGSVCGVVGFVIRFIAVHG